MLVLVSCQADQPSESSDKQEAEGTVSSEWQALFMEKSLEFPPKTVHLLLFKHEQKAELWAPDHNNRKRLVKSYPFNTRLSAKGPRLYPDQPRLPEGIYTVDSTHADKRTALIKTNYPNNFDKKKAKADNRTHKKLDFFIASAEIQASSTAIIEQNALRAIINLVNSVNNPEIIIFPDDPRPDTRFKPCYPCTEWYVELYSMLEEKLRNY